MGIQFRLILIHGVATARIEESAPSRGYSFLQTRFPDAILHEYQFPYWSHEQDYGPSDIGQQARRILDEVAGTRNKEDEYKRGLPLFFMGYDLGGSLVKEIVRLATGEPKYHPIMMDIRTIMFFGTPHKALDEVPWEQHIVRLLSITDALSESAVQLLQQLPQALEDISTGFSTLSHYFRIVNFLQRNGIGSTRPTIAAACARLDVAKENNLELDCDHIQFWDFEDRDSTTELICAHLVDVTGIGFDPVRLQIDHFISALASIDPNTHRVRPIKALPNSLDWVVKHKSYIDWVEDPRASILHITGSSGSGTTVIASHILQMLLQKPESERAVVLSFSFNKQDIRARTLDSLLLSLCRQLLLARPSLFHHVMWICSFLILGGLITTETLWSVLRSLAMHFSLYMVGTPLVCVVDSLHECHVSLNSTLKQLSEFMSFTQGPVKMILTSDLSFTLKSPPKCSYRINLNNRRDNKSAVENFVRAGLSQLARENRLWREKNLQDQVIKKLCGRKPNYLLAVRSMDLLRTAATQSTLSSVKAEIDRVPRTLNESYNRSIATASMDDWVSCALRWIVHAVRPLSERELAVAVALDKSKDQPFELLKNHISVSITADLFHSIGPLIRVIDGQVLPFHRSLRDYLSEFDTPVEQASCIQDRDNRAKDPHLEILTKCLDYIERLIPHSSIVLAENQRPLELSDAKLALIDYARLYWPEHYKLVQPESKIQATLKVNLAAEDSDGYDGLKLAAQEGYSEIVRELLDKMVDPLKPLRSGDTAIHLAAEFGHPLTVGILLKKSPNGVDYMNNRKYSPLHLAAARGYVNILQQLLRVKEPHDIPEGSHVTNDENGTTEGSFVITAHHNRTPLQLAAENGHLAAVQELLEPKIDDSVRNCSIAFFLAAANGHASILERLLKHGIRNTVVDEEGNTPLHVAAREGHVGVILMLPDTPQFAVNPENAQGWTPLHLAANFGKLRTVKELLKLGVGIELVTDNNDTPLLLAAAGGHRLTARELIEKAPDAKSRNREGREAINVAAKRGLVAIVQELLLAGVQLQSPFHDETLVADAEILQLLLDRNQWTCTEPDNRGSMYTPLHVAVLGNSLASVKILLGASVDVNAKESLKRTPLHLAAENGYGDIAEALILAGTNLDAEDHEGCTALYTACYFGKLYVVQALLKSEEAKYRADVRKRAAIRGWAPLHAAHDNADITKLLLEANAEVDCQARNDGLTALAMAVFEDYDVAKLLLQHKANPNVADVDGETSVHCAANGYGGPEMLELLATYETDLDAQSLDKTTPLHLSAKEQEEGVVRFLLEKGAKVDNVSDRYGTALTAAAEGGDVSIAKLILAKCADVNATGGRFHTALQAAVSEGNSEMVDLLLKEGAAVNMRHESIGTALESAIKQGHVGIAFRLLDANAEVNAANKKKESPLQMAVRRSLGSLVQRLIQEGADVDCQESEVDSPLCLAVMKGEGDILEAMLKAGANIPTRFKNGHSLLSYAIWYKLHSRFPVLLDAGARDELALEDAVRASDATMVDALLGLLEGPVVDVSGRESLVNLAIERAHVDILRALDKRGADFHVNDRYGRGVLSHAIDLHRNSIVDYLIQRRDSYYFEQADNHGRTPLTWAVIRHSDCLQDLIRMTSNLDVTDNEGKTPLIYACMNDYGEAVHILLERGADPSIVDCRGRGALYWAARRARLGLFETICDSLFPVQCRSSHFAGALSAAVASRRSNFIDRLPYKYPGIWDLPDAEGWSPTYTAKKYGTDIAHLHTNVEFEEKSFSYLTKRPARWSDTDRSPNLSVSSDGKVITVSGKPGGVGAAYAAIRADFPMVPIPELDNVYYFEVKIDKSQDPRSWGIGFCEEHVELDAMVSWYNGSWGYRGRDGEVYGEGSKGSNSNYGAKYDQDAVIGCGINFDQHVAFYTKDGVVLGKAFTDVKGKLYPAVSVDECMVGSQVSTKFWDGETTNFMYKGSLTAPETLARPEAALDLIADGLELGKEVTEAPDGGVVM
ncbi:Ankyrin repeat-containing domain protein [Metarhizium brunneum]